MDPAALKLPARSHPRSDQASRPDLTGRDTQALHAPSSLVVKLWDLSLWLQIESPGEFLNPAAQSLHSHFRVSSELFKTLQETLMQED